MAENKVHTIAIIGGGFSGAMTAVHLLQSSGTQSLRIVLIESSALARGVAYSTRDPRHLLNVPAGGMSAFVDDEAHFLKYLQQRNYKKTGSDFISRQIYGDYLQDILRSAIAGASERIEFSYLNERAIDIVAHAEKLTINLAGGTAVDVDRIVLATGHASPRLSFLQSTDFNATNRRYIDNPWSENIVERVDPRKPVLLIGSGLTAVDIVMTLIGQRFSQPIYAISRHGLRPLSHRGLSGKSVAPELTFPERSAESLAAITRHLRQRVREVIAAGGDWREVVAALRAQLSALWQKLPLQQRARFLRHGSAYWDIHRHRLAPPVAASISDVLAAKRLNIVAGRIRALADHENGVKVVWRPRGESDDAVLPVGTVINCTGAGSDVRASEDVLHKALLQRGLLKPDALKLGVEIGDDYRVIAATENADGRIFYVGPWLKAKYWEATAVPELRIHARNVAAQILASIENDGLDAGYSENSKNAILKNR